MFYTDWFFLLLLIGLPALSFLSIDPPSLRYSPELFFSALGAASIVILAWERIADSRRVQLRQLMKRVYLDKGEVELYQTLRVVCDYVRRSDGLSGEEAKTIQRVISILERSGRFHGIDCLYPKKAQEELRELSPWLREYHEDWNDWRSRLVEFEGTYFISNHSTLWAIAKGQVELREHDGLLVPYLRGSLNRADKYAALSRERGKKALAFIDSLRRECRYMRRLEDSTWKREILGRASCIRDSFTDFLLSHGLEPPIGSDEEWTERGAVIDRTGSRRSEP